MEQVRERIVIFGIGYIYRENVDKLIGCDVVAVVDNHVPNNGITCDGRKVSDPGILKELEYDCIVIFNKNNIREIFEQLLRELDVAPDKIFGWQYFLYFRKGPQHFYSWQLMEYLPALLEKYNIVKVCDYKMSLAEYGVLNREDYSQMLRANRLEVTGFEAEGVKRFELYDNLYRSYTDWAAYSDSEYDLTMCLNGLCLRDWREAMGIFRSLAEHSKYLLLYYPYDDPKHMMVWDLDELKELGTVENISYKSERGLWITCRDRERLQGTVAENVAEDVAIYTVTHKHFRPLDSGIRIPIHAGRAIAGDLGFPGDDTGDNISFLNQKLNECTALYWIWKHAEQKYVGLEHYRRYFLKPYSYCGDYDTPLDEEDILTILEEYDIIVAYRPVTYPLGVLQEIKNTVSGEAFDACYPILRETIRRKQGDYLEAFDRCMCGYSFFPCNLFVMPKAILDRYCEWLFDIILYVADEVDTKGYDRYSSRVVGFFAERLLTVWLLKQTYRVKVLRYAIRALDDNE